jgi:hypothetical protein
MGRLQSFSYCCSPRSSQGAGSACLTTRFLMLTLIGANRRCVSDQLRNMRTIILE